MKDDLQPWRFLDNYRGTIFEGTWPTLKDVFHISTILYPDRKCWSVYGKDSISYTYSQAEKRIKTIANFLLSLGVTKDTHICVSGRNTPQWAFAFMATLYAGCVVVPLDNVLREEEVENLVTFGDVDYFFGDLDRIKYAEPFVKKVFSLEPSNEYTYIMDLSAPDFKAEPILVTEDDLAAILFTSGTTGNPKGVMLTHKNLVSCCYQAQGNMNISCNDVFYAILPIHHAYTMQAVFIESFSVGAEVVFGKKLIISQVLREMKEGKITMFLGVPMLFNKLLKGLMDGIKKKSKSAYVLVRMMMGISGFFRDVFHINFGKSLFKGLLAKLSLDNIRICICGGGPLPTSTIRMYHQLGLDFVQGYGMTETSPITHLDPIYAFVAKSVGKNCPGIEQKIVNPDEDGNGLIYLRGSAVMKGYYKNPEATKEVLSEDGWLNTGDVGHIDSKGYLYLTGREKNIIVSEGGKNVFPEEIEDMFQLYDELSQVCVTPYYISMGMHIEGVGLLALPSESLMKEYENNKKAIEERVKEIVAEVNFKLPSYKKITKTMVINEPLPETSTKKIKRNEVKKIYGMNWGK